MILVRWLIKCQSECTVVHWKDGSASGNLSTQRRATHSSSCFSGLQGAITEAQVTFFHSRARGNPRANQRRCNRSVSCPPWPHFSEPLHPSRHRQTMYLFIPFNTLFVGGFGSLCYRTTSIMSFLLMYSIHNYCLLPSYSLQVLVIDLICQTREVKMGRVSPKLVAIPGHIACHSHLLSSIIGK